MILFHNPEDELSRSLIESKPQDCAVVVYPDQFYSGPAPAELPSVLVDVPAYQADGQEVPAHLELLRSPASWEAVAQMVAFYAAKAE